MSDDATKPPRRKWPDDYMKDKPDETARGVRCPNCNCPRTRVDYTRHSVGGRNMRRRTCGNCGREFVTFEKS